MLRRKETWRPGRNQDWKGRSVPRDAEILQRPPKKKPIIKEPGNGHVQKSERRNTKTPEQRMGGPYEGFENHKEIKQVKKGVIPISDKERFKKAAAEKLLPSLTGREEK